MGKVKEIILTGLRFHGVLKISQILAQAAVNEGIDVKTAEFTNEPIMSTEICHIRFGEKVNSPLISKGNCEALICLEPTIGIEIAADYLSADGIMIININSIFPLPFPLDQIFSLFDKLAKATIKVDALEIARKIGNVHLVNYVMLGVLLGTEILPLKIENIIKAIEDIVTCNGAKICLEAINLGMQNIITRNDLKYNNIE